MVDGTDVPEHVHKELTLLYQASVSDLAFFKQQQWSSANYALLLLAGEIGAVGLLGRSLRWYEFSILVCFAALTSFVAILLLRKHEAAISIRRDRMAAIRDFFSEEFNRAWGVQGKRDEFVSVLEILEAAVLAGALVAFWLLWVRFGA